MRRILVWSLFMAIAVTSMTQAQTQRRKAQPKAKAKAKAASEVETLPTKRRDELMGLVNKFLDETVNDPKRLDIIKASNAITTKTAYLWRGEHDRRSLDVRATGFVGGAPTASGQGVFWAPVGRPVEIVMVRYRTANALGALIVRDSVFLIAANDVIAEVAPDDFSPVHPKSRASAKAARQREDDLLDDLLAPVGGLK